jgi:type III secretion protein N (ATPase)
VTARASGSEDRILRLVGADPLRPGGRVTAVTGLSIRASLAEARIGDLAEVERPGAGTLAAEVVALRDGEAVLLPLGSTSGLAAGSAVRSRGVPPAIRAGAALLGRVLDGLGRPLDGRPSPGPLMEWPLQRPAPGPMSRGRVTRALPTGVRAIDGLLTLGEGQRLGVVAGAGAGKSVLLGQIARQARADAVVVGLVGERGREVREFVEGGLGPGGLARSAVFVATSDAPAVLRLHAARAATALAEWFAEIEGRSVLLLLDSVTRFARAQREVGLAAGEPPARQGYPPSVFAELPRLLERSGPGARGAITAVYTVLAAGGDVDEPIADEVRGLLDGHVVLDPRLAGRGRHPAVDVPRSLSRLMAALASPPHLAAAAAVREMVDAWERCQDLVAIGAHVRGADPAADRALERIGAVEAFLRQGAGEATPFAETVERLEALAR